MEGTHGCLIAAVPMPSSLSYALAAVVGGDPSGTTPIDTAVCVAKNLDGKKLRQLYEIIVKGVAADGDTAQTTCIFTLTKFNVSVAIQPPSQQ